MTSRRLAAGTGIALGAALVAPAVGHATDFTVSNLNANGTGSLADAMSHVNSDTTDSNASPDRILFASGLSGSISSGALPTISKPVDIVGPGAAALTIDGGGTYGIFDINMAHAHDSVTISGLTLTNAAAYGGPGGAILNHNGTLTVAGSSLVHNNAYDVGGPAIFTEDATTISGSTLSANTASTGSGSPDVYGGAVYATGPLTITDSTIRDNRASGPYGAGGGVFAKGPLTIATSSIRGNSASGGTGGSGGGGGGIDADGGPLTLTGSTIADNSTQGHGGGIVEGGTGPASIATSTISGNFAALGGGGASFDNPTTIDASTISGNTADRMGGGLSLYFGNAPLDPARLTNTTISGNDAGARGGGIYSLNTGAGTSRHLSLDSVTVAGNSAGEGGGGILARAFSTSAGPTLTNTIVGANTSLTGGQDLALGPGSDPFGTAFSLIQNAPSGSFTPAGSDVLGVDPGLDALAANGGPTQTMAPAPGSPVVDRGSTTLAVDQRGQPRQDPEDGANAVDDIGAFETQSAIPTAAPSTSQTPSPPPILRPLLTLHGHPRVSGDSIDLRVVCGSSADCDGIASATSRVRATIEQIVGLAARTHRISIAVGSSRFAIHAGRAGTIRIALNRRARALLRRFRRLPVSLLLSLREPSGGPGIVRAGRVTFRSRRPRHGRRG